MKLKIFSGIANFQEKLHVGSPVVEKEVIDSFHKLLDGVFLRNHLTNDGPLTKELEEKVAERHRVKYSVFVNNATIAQMIALRAMKISKGEALVSANTFIATAHACVWEGLTPVFCDIEPENLNISITDLEKRITDKTKVIIPTHIFGNLAAMPTIMTLAKKYKLAVLADAAHAFDCTLGDTYSGGFSAPEFFSFHATKYFSTFEGGAIVSNDQAFCQELKELRNFGFADYDKVTSLGINAKASEASAAFGLASLPALTERQKTLKYINEIYCREFQDMPGIKIMPIGTNGKNNYRYFAIFVDETEFGLSRDILSAVLWQENVLSRRYFYPGCHRMEYYVKNYPDNPPCLPAADKALGEILCLPTTFTDPDRQIKKLAELIKTIRDNKKAVKKWHQDFLTEQK